MIQKIMENCCNMQFSIIFIEEPVGTFRKKKSFETAPLKNTERGKETAQRADL